MRFDTPAKTNPIDRMQVVGQPVDRIDGARKTTGRATYAYEHNAAVPDAAYGVMLGAGIAKGRIASIDTGRAEKAPGVIAVVTGENAGPLGKGEFYVQRALAAPDVDYYHQAVAIVVAETFEQARAASLLIRVRYVRSEGAFDLRVAKDAAPVARVAAFGPPPQTSVGDFDRAFAAAPVRLDAVYTTPDHSHAMMEPHATIAAWEGDRLTVWTAIQQINWGVRDLARSLGIPKARIRMHAPYIGGGFGGKGTVLSDVVMAALAARAAGRPVKVAMARTMEMNNTTHRPATIQRLRIGVERSGKIAAIGHESWSGNLPDGRPEAATASTRVLYAGAHRMTRLRLAVLDLPEGGAMRAPGEAPGMMALEIAMDELAETLQLDPVVFRVMNDTQVDPENPKRPFSQRRLVECLETGARQFGWASRPLRPGSRREGRWLVGMGMAAAVRGAPVMKSAARVRLARDGVVTVETDMTDIGTGSYTILAQTAAEMLGVGIDRVAVHLGDSEFPESPGSGGQWGAASATAGVYAACVKLRDTVARALGLPAESAEFSGGMVTAGGRSRALADAVPDADLVAEDFIDYGDLAKDYAQQTFGAHFVEVGVDAVTGEIRVRRMLAVCSAGRILNPKMARSQVIGGITMGVGAALMEELSVDRRFGLFINHDLAGYEVPVHSDIPHLDVVFLDEPDATHSPMKAKGVGELGISGVAAAVANAVYNATGVRVREYPVTLDKLLAGLPPVA